MHRNLTPLDISKQPDLLRLAEEVYKTKTPKILTRDNESIAVVMPLVSAIPQRDEDLWKEYNGKRVVQALKQSAGALSGVDKDTLLRDIRAARTQKTKRRFL